MERNSILSRWAVIVIFLILGGSQTISGSFFDITPETNQVDTGNDHTGFGFDAAGSVSKHVDIETPNILNKEKVAPIIFKQPIPTPTTTTTVAPQIVYVQPPVQQYHPPPPHFRGPPPPPGKRPCKRSAQNMGGDTGSYMSGHMDGMPGGHSGDMMGGSNMGSGMMQGGMMQGGMMQGGMPGHMMNMRSAPQPNQTHNGTDAANQTGAHEEIRVFRGSPEQHAANATNSTHPGDDQPHLHVRVAPDQQPTDPAANATANRTVRVPPGGMMQGGDGMGMGMMTGQDGMGMGMMTGQGGMGTHMGGMQNMGMGGMQQQAPSSMPPSSGGMMNMQPGTGMMGGHHMRSVPADTQPSHNATNATHPEHDHQHHQLHVRAVPEQQQHQPVPATANTTAEDPHNLYFRSNEAVEKTNNASSNNTDDLHNPQARMARALEPNTNATANRTERAPQMPGMMPGQGGMDNMNMGGSGMPNMGGMGMNMGGMPNMGMNMGGGGMPMQPPQQQPPMNMQPGPGMPPMQQMQPGMMPPQNQPPSMNMPPMMRMRAVAPHNATNGTDPNHDHDHNDPNHQHHVRAAPEANLTNNASLQDATAQHNLHTRSIPEQQQHQLQHQQFQPNFTGHPQQQQQQQVPPFSHGAPVPPHPQFQHQQQFQPGVHQPPLQFPNQPQPPHHNQHQQQPEENGDAGIDKRAVSPKFGMLGRMMEYFN